jgi:hypothetical protein
MAPQARTRIEPRVCGHRDYQRLVHMDCGGFSQRSQQIKCLIKRIK